MGFIQKVRRIHACFKTLTYHFEISFDYSANLSTCNVLFVDEAEEFMMTRLRKAKLFIPRLPKVKESRDKSCWL